MTAPVVGSMGAPVWTARVPKRWTGDGALGGVSMVAFCSCWAGSTLAGVTVVAILLLSSTTLAMILIWG